MGAQGSPWPPPSPQRSRVLGSASLSTSRNIPAFPAAHPPPPPGPGTCPPLPWAVQVPAPPASTCFGWTEVVRMQCCSETLSLILGGPGGATASLMAAGLRRGGSDPGDTAHPGSPGVPALPSRWTSACSWPGSRLATRTCSVPRTWAPEPCYPQQRAPGAPHQGPPASARGQGPAGPADPRCLPLLCSASLPQLPVPPAPQLSPGPSHAPCPHNAGPGSLLVREPQHLRAAGDQM